MARSVKPEEHAAKRTEILDSALRLIYAKGYQKMTIQDILNDLKISKGALYHYFDSKEALLEALVDRMGRAAEQALLPVIQDPHLTALQKLQRYFEVSADWKQSQKTLILSLLRMWYSDENAFIRQKLNEASRTETARLLEPILRQGIQEKVFNTPFPRQAAVVVAGVYMSLSDMIITLLLKSPAGIDTAEELSTTLRAAADMIERILGAPSGSLMDINLSAFAEWSTDPRTDILIL